MILNENDPFAAAWLRNLFPSATVDERSILDVKAADLDGHGRAHFFAGIGGWEYALELAGWGDEEVWTGSCPCQPFSVAGKAGGVGDERHLWPAFHRLISERRPPVVFGEQVASRAGRDWLSGVRVDLEALGYAVGAADLCAAGVGAPHIRQRLFWVADSTADGREQECADGRGGRGGSGAEGWATGSGLRSASGELGEPVEPRLEGHAGDVEDGHEPGRLGAFSAGSAWASGQPLLCLDGKTRRVEPSIFPLAHGVPGRVGRLRAYGNAIIPPLAAVFVRAFMETRMRERLFHPQPTGREAQTKDTP